MISQMFLFDLPLALSDLICRFAWNYTLKHVRRSLLTLKRLKEKRICSCLFTDEFFDFQYGGRVLNPMKNNIFHPFMCDHLLISHANVHFILKSLDWRRKNVRKYCKDYWRFLLSYHPLKFVFDFDNYLAKLLGSNHRSAMKPSVLRQLG
jgi:hypothetical protein